MIAPMPAPRSRLRLALLGATLLVAFAGAGLGLLVAGSRSGPARSGPATGAALSARSAAAVAFDPFTETVVLFGGRRWGADAADTWTWDGSQWTEEHPPVSPPAREGASLAYDGLGHRLLLAGGVLGGGTAVGLPEPGTVCPLAAECPGPPRPADDTWAWDGRTWVQLSPAHRVVGVLGMATDPQTGRVVAVGHSPVVACPPPGKSACPLPFEGPSSPLRWPGDLRTWTWDGRDWIDAGPFPSSFLPLAITDDGRDVVALTETLCAVEPLASGEGGGGVPPTPVCAAARSGGAASDPGRTAEESRGTTGDSGGTASDGAAATVGGAVSALACLPTPAGCPSTNFRAPTVRLLRWRAGAWTVVDSGSVGPSAPVVAARDGDGRGLLAVDLRGETWTWDGTTWTLRHPAHSPGPLARPALADDLRHHQDLLVGGAVGGDLLDATWTWDGRDWRLASGHAPVPTPPCGSTPGVQAPPPSAPGPPTTSLPVPGLPTTLLPVPRPPTEPLPAPLPLCPTPSDGPGSLPGACGPTTGPPSASPPSPCSAPSPGPASSSSP